VSIRMSMALHAAERSTGYRLRTALRDLSW